MLNKNNYRVIDISKKTISYRRACVNGSIYVGKKVFNLIKNNQIEKGDPIILAEIAGINAAKNISNLILLSHQINIENIFLNILMDDKKYKINVYCTVFANSKTGVEMEAMCGVAISLLTIYDLTKKFNPFIFIDCIKLLFKDGGENGLILGSINNVPQNIRKNFFSKSTDLKNITSIIITLSHRSFYGIYNDISGQILLDFLLIRKSSVLKKIILPDNDYLLKKVIENISLFYPNFIFITGGTGPDKKDITYSVLKNLCDKNIQGMGELIRLIGASYSKYAWLSSTSVNIYKKSTIISLPGNPSSVFEILNNIEDLLFHTLNLNEHD